MGLMARIEDLYNAYKNAGVDPATVAGWGTQAAEMFGGYRDSLMLLRRDRGRLERQGRVQVKDIRRQGEADLSSAAAAASDRGVLGSSVDVSTRAAVRSNTGASIVAARDAREQAIRDNIAQALSARRDFFSGMGGLDAQRAAAKAMGAAGAFGEGLWDHLIPGGAGGKGQPGTMKRAVNTADSFKELLQGLEKAGWRVGETGVQGFDPVDPWAHAAAGNHYIAPKRTADLNYGPSGASQVEREKIAKLIQLMKKAGIPIEQWFGPQNDPAGHDDHLHLTTARKRW
jgi:hypothetical protein